MTRGSKVTYKQLLVRYQPGPVQDEADYERLMSIIEELYPLREESEAVARFMELVTMLVHEFEVKAHALPELSRVDMLQFLMEERGLLQKDLIDVFKTKSIVSDVLNGKRDLTTEHIARLVTKFSVPATVFFPSPVMATA